MPGDGEHPGRERLGELARQLADAGPRAEARRLEGYKRVIRELRLRHEAGLSQKLGQSRDEGGGESDGPADRV